MKRLLSILLALCLLLGALPVSVSAADGDFVINANGVLTGYHGSGRHAVIPDGVTSIGEGVFSSWSNLTSITIPNSVTSIGSRAFSGCTGLTSITIPDSVTSIGWHAFSRCAGLTSITIPDSVTSIGGGAFGFCTNLSKIEVSSGNSTYILSEGIVYTKDMSDLVVCPAGKAGAIAIPDGVNNIVPYAFSGCTGLTSIAIPNSVSSIGFNTFERCTGLTSIKIPDSVTSIGEGSFSYCTSLENIEVSSDNSEYISSEGILYTKDMRILVMYPAGKTGAFAVPDSVIIIRMHAFAGCAGLTDIDIPNSVIYIESNAFSDCTGLSSVPIPDSVTLIGYYTFIGCKGLASITMPDGVTSIGVGTFQDCKGLTNITVPNSVTSIGTDAFFQCIGLTSITIPESVTSVGESAFFGCKNLKDIYYGGTKEQWQKISIGGLNEYLTNAAIHYNISGPDSDKESPNQYIIERVKSYTSDEVHDQWMNIMESDDSDEIKAERMVELFLNNGFLDVWEGVEYLSHVSEDRLHYLMLTDNECYSAYQYYNWLYNTTSGKATIALLWADGLIFNNELSTWTNPLTYTGEKDLPGVAKYKDMLYDFMNATSFDIELMQYISSISKLAKNATSGGDMYAQKLIGELNDCKNSGEILQRMQESNPSAKGLYLSLKKNSENDSGLSFKLDETSGFGKFSKAMGYSGKIISTADASVSFAVDLLTLDSKLAVYEQYRDFLQEVMISSDLPWELSLAAYSVLQEMEEGAYGEIKDFAITLIEQTGVTQIITDSVWTKMLGKVGASTFTGYLSLIELESWCINQIVDVGAMVKEVGCVIGYAKLQIHYIQKLETSKANFKKDQTEENAWDFFENYNLLYQLRSRGEKAVQELYKIDGFLSYFTDLGQSENIEKINMLLQKLESCRFTIDENIEMPESVKYVSKAVIRCPVNVEIFAPNGDYITTLVDGVESDVTNEYGRFAVVYQVRSTEYVKVICLSNEGDYKIKLVGTEDGSVDFEFARSVGSNSEMFKFSEVEVSQNTVIQTSTNQIIHSHDYDIDYDGDGIFESTGSFQKIESASTNHFDDIKSTAYYYDAVMWAVRNGITSGTGQNKFSPNLPCTRGQIVTFLWRSAGKPKPQTSINPFSDVKPTDYYYNAVLWAVENNITSGVGNGKFAPGQPCTRGQAVTFLWRAEGNSNTTSDSSSFTDVKVGSYYEKAVKWAVANKVTSGTSATTFSPNQSCTRGQIVTFLYRANS